MLWTTRKGRTGFKPSPKPRTSRPQSLGFRSSHLHTSKHAAPEKRKQKTRDVTEAKPSARPALSPSNCFVPAGLGPRYPPAPRGAAAPAGLVGAAAALREAEGAGSSSGNKQLPHAAALPNRRSPPRHTSTLIHRRAEERNSIQGVWSWVLRCLCAAAPPGMRSPGGGRWCEVPIPRPCHGSRGAAGPPGWQTPALSVDTSAANRLNSPFHSIPSFPPYPTLSASPQAIVPCFSCSKDQIKPTRLKLTSAFPHPPSNNVLILLLYEKTFPIKGWKRV